MTICEEHGIEVVYLDTVLDSSSRLLQQFASQAMTISEFETRVHEQRLSARATTMRSTSAENGAEGNNYSLEKRREIEAKNPFLIKEVFQPSKVLDLGCGPAPDDLCGRSASTSRDRLRGEQPRSGHSRSTRAYRHRRGDRSALKPADAYDLVICREVLEHLTVLRCGNGRQHGADDVALRLVTTRFHPNPDGLLDFTRSSTSIRATSRCSTRTCCA